MKFARFTNGSTIYMGEIMDEKVSVIEGDLFGNYRYTDQEFTFNEIKLLAPLKPNQIIGIGANYAERLVDVPAQSPALPVFFFKPTSSVIGPEDHIVIPNGLDTVKFESELAVIIGKKAKNVPESQVSQYIFGYTVANDITAREYFHPNGHWTIGKAFDTFTPLGPVIETELDVSDVQVTATLNGELKQNGSTELLVTPIYQMIAYLSSVMTLQPGDVILTGTPAGAGLMRAGDEIICSVEAIGSLKNRVVVTESGR
ncbi:MAG: fumarylacetoacetate hydrolase family protein [Bacillus sp. (in: firmicutes)]